ncbi:MAG TPA: FAD binding domain-containing protein [Ornithinibacter sp.]|nr:FAD binding domain-containing protein [Ornithinibacter sp.]
MTTTAYWRPSSIAQALDLLERPGAVVLAGGTRLNGRPATADSVEVVDLQALDLDGLRPGAGDELTVGAMTTLQEVVDGDGVPDVVREAARREQPSTLRAQGTVGGCIATGHPESELLAALLVHEAVVHVSTRDAAEAVALEALLAGLPIGAGRVVTAVTIRTTGRAAACRTARTPADRAIVAAVARATDGGPLVALTGAAATPVLVGPGHLPEPPGDFRGASDYRRALAEVLVARALEAIA